MSTPYAERCRAGPTTALIPLHQPASSPSSSPGSSVAARRREPARAPPASCSTARFGYGQGIGFTLLLRHQLHLHRARGRGRLPLPASSTSAARARPISAASASRSSCLAFDACCPGGWPSRSRSSPPRCSARSGRCIPAYLQAKRGSHIVITTIMFNFIAASLMVYLLVDVLKPAGEHGAADAHLPRRRRNCRSSTGILEAARPARCARRRSTSPSCSRWSWPSWSGC